MNYITKLFNCVRANREKRLNFVMIRIKQKFEIIYQIYGKPSLQNDGERRAEKARSSFYCG